MRIRTTHIGLPQKLQLANGRVLTRDAGSLTYEASFDANGDFTGLTLIDVNGPHAGFDSNLWCDVAIEALGL